MFERDWYEFWANFYSKDPGQDIWQKVNKSNKTRTDQKTLISAFA